MSKMKYRQSKFSRHFFGESKLKFITSTIALILCFFTSAPTYANMPSCYDGICLNAVVDPDQIKTKNLEFEQSYYCGFVAEFSRGKPGFDEFLIQVFVENYNIGTSNDIIRIPKGTVIRIERNIPYLHTEPLNRGLTRSELREWDRRAYDAIGIVLDRVRDAVIVKYGAPSSQEVNDTILVYSDNKQLRFRQYGSRQNGQYLVLSEEIWRTGLDQLYTSGAACSRDQEREDTKEIIPD